MLKIRLKRVGRKHDPSYRVVLIDSKLGPKSGKINEILGFYDPRKDIKELRGEEIKAWISKGAQVSDTVHNILIDQKVIEGKKINTLPKKRPIVKEQTEEEKKNDIKEEVAPRSESQQDNSTSQEEVKKDDEPTKTEESTVEEKTEEEPIAIVEESNQEETPVSEDKKEDAPEEASSEEKPQ